MGGLRRYQNPALAELIDSVAAENQAEIEHFEQYVLELANEKDQSWYTVAGQGRPSGCRSTLSRQPGDTPKTIRKTQ